VGVTLVATGVVSFEGVLAALPDEELDDEELW